MVSSIVSIRDKPNYNINKPGEKFPSIQSTSDIKATEFGYKVNFGYNAKICENFFVGLISNVDCSDFLISPEDRTHIVKQKLRAFPFQTFRSYPNHDCLFTSKS